MGAAVDEGILMTRVTTAIAVGLALCISAGAVAAQKISLMNPAAFKDEAPPTYNVRFDTSAGRFASAGRASR